MKLSIVMPAHNEEQNLPNTVAALAHTLSAAKIPFEIVIVDDHSTDRTPQVAQELAHAYPQVRCILNLLDPGFGMAVRAGLNQYSGECVCIVMADGSEDPADVVRYYEKLQEGWDCVLGSRFTRQSRIVSYPPHKLVLNRLANWFIQALFALPYDDVTNAFKCYRRNVIEGVQPLLSCHFNLTVELPLKAIVRGYTYTVIPINWYGRVRGVSKLRIKEMGSRYLFIVLYVWLERSLSGGDYFKGRNRPVPPADSASKAASAIVSADPAPSVPRPR